MTRRLIASSLLAVCAGCSSDSDDGETDRPNTPPEFTGEASASVRENAKDTGLTLTAEDADGDDLAFAITGGADADAFVLEGDRLFFAEAPDFEAPGDQDGDNAYVVDIEVGDGTDAAVRTFRITVADGPDGRLTREGVLRLSATPRAVGDLDGDGLAEVAISEARDRTRTYIVRGAALAAAEGATVETDDLAPQDGVLVTASERYEFILGRDLIGGSAPDVVAYALAQGTDDEEDTAATVVIVLADIDILSVGGEDGTFDLDAAVAAAPEGEAFVLRTTDQFDEALARTVFVTPRRTDDARAVLGLGQEGRGYLFEGDDLPALEAASPFFRPPASVGTEIGSVDADAASFEPIGDVDADGLTDYVFANLDEVVVVFGDTLPASGTVDLASLATTRIAPRGDFGIVNAASGQLGGGSGADLILDLDDTVVFDSALTGGGVIDPDAVPGSGDGYAVTTRANANRTARLEATGRLLATSGPESLVASFEESTGGLRAGDPVRAAVLLDPSEAAADADGILEVSGAMPDATALIVDVIVPSGADGFWTARTSASVVGDIDGDGLDELAISTTFEIVGFGGVMTRTVRYLISGTALQDDANAEGRLTLD